MHLDDQLGVKFRRRKHVLQGVQTLRKGGALPRLHSQRTIVVPPNLTGSHMRHVCSS